jgi:hypothetical protein
MLRSIYFMAFCISFTACQLPPTKESLAGKYVVTATLLEKEEIKDKIRTDVDQAKKELKQNISDAKKELQDIDLSDIDTTTAEGKLEYYSRKVASDIGSSVLEMETGLSGLMDGLAGLSTAPIDALESILENSNINVELQQDGDVKLSGMFSIASSNLMWDVEGEEIVVKQNENEKARITITHRDDNGFNGIYEKWKVRFNKKY